MTANVLVAGIGNLFLTDDAFGSEVARRRPVPAAGGRQGRRLRHPRHAPGLRPARGYDALVVVDALPGEGAPGDLRVLEVGLKDLGEGEDAHGLASVAVLASLGQLGGTLPRPTSSAASRPTSARASDSPRPLPARSTALSSR